MKAAVGRWLSAIVREKTKQDSVCSPTAEAAASASKARATALVPSFDFEFVKNLFTVLVHSRRAGS